MREFAPAGPRHPGGLKRQLLDPLTVIRNEPGSREWVAGAPNPALAQPARATAVCSAGPASTR